MFFEPNYKSLKNIDHYFQTLNSFEFEICFAVNSYFQSLFETFKI